MPKKSSELREKIHALHEENEYKATLDNRGRCRSITVGTAFGGTIEITLRNEFSTMYALLQPVEAVEFMEQIAAGCGIELAMRPKQNFTSWRGWAFDDESSNSYMKGSAPWQLEGQEFNKKLQAMREDMMLEVEHAKMQAEKEKQIKKLTGSSSKTEKKLLSAATEEEKIPKKPRTSRKKTTSKVEETNE